MPKRPNQPPLVRHEPVTPLLTGIACGDANRLRRFTHTLSPRSVVAIARQPSEPTGFLSTAHRVIPTHFDWGCMDRVHVGWAVIEADSEARARLAVPPLV